MTSIEPAVDEKIKSIPHYVTIDKMPTFLLQAVISVEDTRFYTHKGFDIFGIARAVLVNVEAGEIQEGASTITQQTVKNLFLTSDQTFTRKAEELILSMNMEKDFDKDKILEIYLNSIYFGSNFYGIYDAAQGYFGKEPNELTIAECAMLAGTSIFIWLSKDNLSLLTQWKSSERLARAKPKMLALRKLFWRIETKNTSQRSRGVFCYQELWLRRRIQRARKCVRLCRDDLR